MEASRSRDQLSGFISRAHGAAGLNAGCRAVCPIVGLDGQKRSLRNESTIRRLCQHKLTEENTKSTYERKKES